MTTPQKNTAATEACRGTEQARMTPERIKAVRKALDLRQEELATILGVTPNTVARYEMKGGHGPTQGEVEKKLAQLEATIADKEHMAKLKKLRATSGGVAALAGVVALGAAILPAATAAVGVVSLGGILGGTAGAALLSFLQLFQTDNDEEE